LLRPAAGGAELLTWKQILPQLGDLVQLFDATIWLFGLIFMLAAALGVVNTLLMSTFERIREFGVLKALGAGPWRIVRDVACEAYLLALLSTAIGLVVGLAASAYFRKYGIDLTGLGGDITFSGVAFNPIWRATITPKIVWIPVVSMWVVCVLAALYPAAKAARLDPVRALVHV
ncbi:MAG: ABC transporter permease, partial [Deltaproteobacteria bacterium]